MQFSRGTVLEDKFFNSMGGTIWTLILKCILTDQQVIIQSVAEETPKDNLLHVRHCSG